MKTCVQSFCVCVCGGTKLTLKHIIGSITDPKQFLQKKCNHSIYDKFVCMYIWSEDWEVLIHKC